MHDADLLAVSLTELDRTGWSLDALLGTQKDLPDSVVVSLVAAMRVHTATRPVPSDEFRARLKHRLANQIQADAVQSARQSSVSPLRRVTRRLTGKLTAPAALALFAFAGAGVVTASNAAHPQTALYPIKAVVERVMLDTAFTPSEKLGIRLRLATSRLSEAAEEIREGHLPVATTLLREFDHQVAAAQSAGVVDNQDAATPSVVSVGQRLTLLQGERSRVASKMFGPPASAPVTVTQPAPAAVDPSKLATAPSSSSVDSRAPQLDATTASNPLALAPRATAVAAASTVSSSLVASGRTNALSESSQLVFLLLTQAREGAGDAALVTAREYASVLQSLSSTSPEVVDVLRVQRENISTAIVDAPHSTINALSLALSCVDDALATTRIAPTRFASPTAPIAVGTSIEGDANLQRPSNGSIAVPSAPLVPNKVAPPVQGSNAATPAGGMPAAPAAGAASSPSSAPARPPQIIGRPAGPVGAPAVPITLPKPTGSAPPPPPSVGHPSGPPSVVSAPIVSAPVIVRAPARFTPPKKVTGKPHSKIGK